MTPLHDQAAVTAMEVDEAEWATRRGQPTSQRPLPVRTLWVGTDDLKTLFPLSFEHHISVPFLYSSIPFGRL